MKSVHTSMILSILTLISTIQAISQSQVYQIQTATIDITGESSLHDWKVEAGAIADYPEELTLDINSGSSIAEFGFKVSVSSLDGGRGAAMNKKILKALKSDTHPFISYTQASPATYTLTDDHELLLTSKGIVDIGGAQKEIVIEVIGRIDGNSLVLSVDYPMKLSDFDIEPPSAMFGQIQTKDDIVIHFEFIYKEN